MAIMAAFNLEAHQYDIVNAFTNSELDETIQCACPEGTQKMVPASYCSGPFMDFVAHQYFGLKSSLRLCENWGWKKFLESPVCSQMTG